VLGATVNVALIEFPNPSVIPESGENLTPGMSVDRVQIHPSLTKLKLND
jgi:hypothetical protein